MANLDSLINELTMADLELVETISGVSISKMDDPAAPKAGLMVSLAFILARKNGDPKTLDEIRALPIGEVEKLLGTEDEEASADPED